MSDEKPETAETPETPEPGPEQDAKKDDLIETAIGLAVLGLGAALFSGGRGLGGIVRTVVNGPAQRTPPIAPGLNGVDDVLRERRPW